MPRHRPSKQHQIRLPHDDNDTTMELITILAAEMHAEDVAAHVRAGGTAEDFAPYHSDAPMWDGKPQIGVVVRRLAMKGDPRFAKLITGWLYG